MFAFQMTLNTVLGVLAVSYGADNTVFQPHYIDLCGNTEQLSCYLQDIQYTNAVYKSWANAKPTCYSAARLQFKVVNDNSLYYGFFSFVIRISGQENIIYMNFREWICIF